MAKRSSAKWRGVLEFPALDLVIDGGLYSTTRRGRTPLPLIQIHTACTSRLKSDGPPPEERRAKDADGEEEGKDEEGTAPPQVALQAHCPTCNRALRHDEVGRAVEASIGLIQITDEEYRALKPEKTKVVRVGLVCGFDEALKTIGAGRRFYVLPKPESVDAYYRLFAVLSAAHVAGFVQDLLVDKRAYNMVIRPIPTLASVFGSVQSVLIADEFQDTDLLRDPREFQLLPAEEPPVSAKTAKLIIAAQRAAQPLNPDDCINPERRRFKALVGQKLKAQRML